MRAFLCAVDESVWDSVENGYVKPITAKSEWDKAALALAHAIVRPLMLYSVVCPLMSFIGYRT